MELNFPHLHQRALPGPCTRRYATPSTHPSEMCLCPDLLHYTQGHRPCLDRRQCFTLRTGQQRQIELLDTAGKMMQVLPRQSYRHQPLDHLTAMLDLGSSSKQVRTLCPKFASKPGQREFPSSAGPEAWSAAT
jgi:hypothetical protein